jgi:hypothetical protein
MTRSFHPDQALGAYLQKFRDVDAMLGVETDLCIKPRLVGEHETREPQRRFTLGRSLAVSLDEFDRFRLCA